MRASPNGTLQTAHLSRRDHRAFAWVLSIARHGTGTHLSPLRVEFVQTRSNLKAMERHFGCPVVRGLPSQRNCVSCRRSPSVGSRLAMPSFWVCSRLSLILEEEIVDENFVERVRLAIQQKLTAL